MTTKEEFQRRLDQKFRSECYSGMPLNNFMETAVAAFFDVAAEVLEQKEKENTK